MPPRTYLTGLITTDHPAACPLPPWKGRGWQADLGEQRTDRRVGPIKVTYSRIDALPNEKSVEIEGREIVITSFSRVAAQRALDRIWAALHLLQGNPPLMDAPEAFPTDDQNLEGLSSEDLTRLKGYRCNQPNISVACCAGAKASHHRDLTYALALYHLSQSIHGNYHI